MPLVIIKPGLLDTIQDEGRFGYSRYGVNPGGIMDRFAAATANILAGNTADKALLEFHFPAPQAMITENALISVTGADFGARINDEALPPWHPVIVRKNSLIHFTAHRKGARGYLAVHAGFYVEKWLGSYSTNIRASAGGFKGRKFEKGDEVSFNFHELKFEHHIRPQKNFRVLPWSPDVRDVYSGKEISFIKGHEWTSLVPDAMNLLEQEKFLITSQSDRMGYQLSGAPLLLKEPLQSITSPVSFGTIQLLPDGQLIILMADHQTTGGYPRVGHVISADLPKLAQLCAGDSISFKATQMDIAESRFIRQLKDLEQLRCLCNQNLNDFLCGK